MHVEAALPPGPIVFAEHVHRVIDDKAEAGGGDDGGDDAYLADEDRPHPESDQHREEVRKQADEAQPDAAQGDDQGYGDEQEGERRTLQHAADVSVGQIGEHYGSAARLRSHRRRGVCRQPGLGLGRYLAYPFCGHGIQGGRQPGRGLVDVYQAIEIETVGQGHLVKQQVLGRQFAFVGQPVPVRIVGVHVLVQPFHDVGETVDMGDVGPGPQPRGKGLDPFEIGRLRDTAGLAAADGEFERIRADKVGGGEVRIDAEGDAFIEPFDEPVVQFDARDEGHDDQCRRARAPQQRPAFGHDQVSEPVHGGGRATGPRFDAHR